MARLPSGELENQVLAVLWSHDGALTPGEVHRTVSASRPLAYTTTMTILVRLWRKGMVEREQRGRAFAYRPKLTQEESAAVRMHELLATAGDHSVALGHFVESLPADQLSELRKALRRAKSQP